RAVQLAQLAYPQWTTRPKCSMTTRRGTPTGKTQPPTRRLLTAIQPTRGGLFCKAPGRSTMWVDLVLLGGGSRIYIREQAQNFDIRAMHLNKRTATITPTKKICWHVSANSSVAAMQLLIKRMYSSLPYKAGECQTGLRRCGTTRTWESWNQL